MLSLSTRSSPRGRPSMRAGRRAAPRSGPSGSTEGLDGVRARCQDGPSIGALCSWKGILMPVRSASGLALAALLLAALAGPAAPAVGQGSGEPATRDGQLGTVDFATSCSPAVQDDFNRA